MSRSFRIASKWIDYVKSAFVRSHFARQQDLADQLMISRDTISRFFNGKPVSSPNFLEICEKLGLDFHQIADFEQENPEASLSFPGFCNLPPRDYSQFIGRQQEIKQLLNYISPNYRQYITIVEGIGGVGKTTLVLEVAHLCWQAKLGNIKHLNGIVIPVFDAIIFTSAKETYLKPFGILKRPIKEATLRAIFQTIAETLNNSTIMQAGSIEEQIRRVYHSLNQQSTLLIIDNMETIRGEDREQILSFLADVPITVQVIITTRERIILHSSIRLESLSEQESLELILQQAKEKDTIITEEQALRLYHRFGGIPLALIYAVGQRAFGYSIKRTLDPTGYLPEEFPEDIGRYCFDGSVAPLRKTNTDTHKLLMSLALFKNHPSREAIAEVAGLTADPITVENGLATLQILSLVRESQERYTMLPLTREYTLAELAKYPEFEKTARERWFKWFLNFVDKYGGKDWENFQIKYDHLNEEWENLEEVLNWLGAQERYNEVKSFWKNIDHFVDLYGYWETRLEWWSWLQKFAHRTADLSIYVEALSTQGWTLILKGGQENEEKANNMLQEAWKLKTEADRSVQINLAINIAVVYKLQGSYPKALEYLDQAESSLNQGDLKEREYLRRKVAIDYYRSEIYLLQKDYNRSKQLLEQVIEYGEGIKWQRFVNYAQNLLADIEIAQKNWSMAEQLLERGLLIAKTNKEERRIAFYQASYARLKKAQQNLEEARDWAKKALEGFEGKGILREAEEMRFLLQELSDSE